MSYPSIRGVVFRPCPRSNRHAVGSNGIVIVAADVRSDWRVLKSNSRGGRAHVAINGRQVAVDRLVLESFSTIKPKPGMVPIHVNGDRSDNRVSSLRWGYRSGKSRKFNAPPDGVKTIAIASCEGFLAGSDGYVWTRWKNGGSGIHRKRRRVVCRRVDGVMQSVVRFNDGIRRLAPIAELILEAFGSPRPAGHAIGHIDGNVRNTRPDNLRWEPTA